MTLVFCIMGLLSDDEVPTDDLIRRETLKKDKHDTIK
jgi:hypothetical protein